MNPAKTPNPWPAPVNEHHEAVRRRAEEIYARNGKIPGHDLENWAQAEREILRESPTPAARRAAVIIKVKGNEYVGEYDPASSDGYRPGEFGANSSVLVTFHGDQMQVLRPNGKTLETTLIQLPTRTEKISSDRRSTDRRSSDRRSSGQSSTGQRSSELCPTEQKTNEQNLTDQSSTEQSPAEQPHANQPAASPFRSR